MVGTEVKRWEWAGRGSGAVRRVGCQHGVCAQRGTLPSHKGTGHCVSTGGQNGHLQGLAAEEGGAVERRRISG